MQAWAPSLVVSQARSSSGLWCVESEVNLKMAVALFSEMSHPHGDPNTGTSRCCTAHRPPHRDPLPLRPRRACRYPEQGIVHKSVVEMRILWKLVNIALRYQLQSGLFIFFALPAKHRLLKLKMFLAVFVGTMVYSIIYWTLFSMTTVILLQSSLFFNLEGYNFPPSRWWQTSLVYKVLIKKTISVFFPQKSEWVSCRNIAAK